MEDLSDSQSKLQVARDNSNSYSSHNVWPFTSTENQQTISKSSSIEMYRPKRRGSKRFNPQGQSNQYLSIVDSAYSDTSVMQRVEEESHSTAYEHVQTFEQKDEEAEAIFQQIDDAVDDANHLRDQLGFQLVNLVLEKMKSLESKH